MESTFALNVLQKLDHCFTITNYFFSVVLQDVADSESRLDIGPYGQQSDGGTFSGSTLYHFLKDLEPTLPKPASCEGSGTEASFIVCGDKACPLQTYLMKPFARKDMSGGGSVFNCRLS
jgi:hypothetical protein